tara:strand:- start:373 stop:564 length:192 start_codon:yes stop_codon:yes gene_type:complete
MVDTTDKTYQVTKTVTEYHTFEIKATSAEEAMSIAECNDKYYCDGINADSIAVEVETARELID